MVSVKVASVAGAVALFATVAHAADMPELPPVYVPQIEEYSASGWYLRGDIGMTNQGVSKMHQVFEDFTTEKFDYRSKSFDSSPLFGIGLGYQYNNWLRFDITAEYRGRANLHATAVGNQGSVDNYQGSKSEYTGLVNAYVDLGTWAHVTPFVGAGLGLSYNRIHDFYDTCAALSCAGQIVAVADGTGSKLSFAWALHAGLAYQVTPSLTIELAYRYINLGDAQSGYFHNIDPSQIRHPGPYEFQNLTSHDLKLGIRWMLEPAPRTEQISLPPLMRRG
jgi:opacity protein-like surface antigen